MKNIIDAIINLVEHPKVELVHHAAAANRANNMGDALEEYIKDLFAGTVWETDENRRNRKIKEVFSYIGNDSNPPDGMLRGGDAIEVKKLQGMSKLSLNSSHPKRMLRRDNPKISEACRCCENWSEKDMLYVVGICNRGKIKQLCMVYGTEYCADIELYSGVEAHIKNGLESMENVEPVQTNELGRLNRVDPLGITDLRVRSMWILANPLHVFDYVYRPDRTKAFNFMALIRLEKYETFSNVRALESLAENIEGLAIEDVKIKDPNDPAQLIDCKLVTFTI